MTDDVVYYRAELHERYVSLQLGKQSLDNTMQKGSETDITKLANVPSNTYAAVATSRPCSEKLDFYE